MSCEQTIERKAAGFRAGRRLVPVREILHDREMQQRPRMLEFASRSAVLAAYPRCACGGLWHDDDRGQELACWCGARMPYRGR